MSPLPHSPSSDRSRRLVGVFVGAVVIVAIATPASYYATGKTYDERFAWRMFSGKRAERCAVQVTETRAVGDRQQQVKLPLTRLIHKAWESGLKRLRPDIVERFFDMRCAVDGVTSLTLVRRCRRADGGAKPNDEVERVCPIRLVVP